MDRNSPIESQTSPQDPSVNQITSVQTQFPWKYVSFGLILIILVGIGGICSFYFGIWNKSTAQPSVDNTIAATPTLAIKEVGSNKSLADLSYAYANGTLYMKYKFNVFTKDTSYEPQSASTPDNVKWISLPVVRPITDDNSGYHGLFDFKSFSKGKFVFIMRWEGESYVYYFDELNQSAPIKEVTTFSQKTAGYNVPKVYLTDEAISKDGKFVVLDLFGCWNCGGHIPETVIVEISTGKIKNIGKISTFNWLQGNKYQYKISKLIPCAANIPEDQCYEAYEKSENLPYIQGQFE
ncbi:MAG: hypothetical protein WBO77_00895 [Microgenomates group bacterium]